MIVPSEQEIGFTAETPDDFGFVAEPPKKNWAPLYAGLDSTPADPAQRDALAFVDNKLGPDKETRAAAINQQYVKEKMPTWNSKSLDREWPNVRAAFAKQSGFTQGEDLSDVQLYGHIANSIAEQEKKDALARDFAAATPDKRMALLAQNFGHLFKLNAMEWFASTAKPFAEIPRAPEGVPDLPNLGPSNPAIWAGIWNGMVKPAIEGVESPLGLGTIGIGAGLSAAKTAGVPLASKALSGLSGFFTGLMAKTAAEKVPEAVKVAMDPNASLQQKVEAVGAPAMDATFAILAGFHAVGELHPAPKQVFAKMEGKTPEQAATVLREEANAATEPALVEALTDTAEKLDEIPSVKPQETVSEALGAERPVETEAPRASAEQAAPSAAESRPPEIKVAEVSPEDATPISSAKEIPVEQVAKQYSIKNAAIEKDLKAMGEDPPTKGEKITDQMAADKAAETMRADPMSGRKLIEELSSNPRPLSTDDVTLARFEYVRLNLERDRLQTALEEAQGRNEPTQEITDAIDAVRADIKDTADVLRPAKGEQGRAFRALQLFTKEDYSLGTMERRRAESRGGNLTPEEAATVKELSDRIAAKDKELEGMRQTIAAAVDTAERERAPGKAKPPSKIAERLTEQAKLARERIVARLRSGQTTALIDPVNAADYAIVGADYIARGVTKFAEWSKEMIKEFGTKIMPDLKAIYDRAMEHNADEAHAVKLEVEKAKLEKSIKVLEKKIEDKDLSGPPKRANRPAEGELEVLKQKKEALAAELSGMRETAAKIKELEESVAQKTEKIAAGDLATEKQAKNRPAPEAIETLKQERDALNKELADARKEAKKPTDEQRIAKELEGMKKQIAAKEAALASGDVAPKGQRANRPLPRELEEAKQQLERLNEEIAAARKGPPVDPEQARLNAKKRRTAASITELRRRIADGDFEPKAKKELLKLDEEANRLEAERTTALLEYEHLLEQDRYEKAPALEKLKTQAVNLYDAARLLITTGEFSFILRQGKVGVLSHPIEAAKAIPDTFRAFSASQSMKLDGTVKGFFRFLLSDPEKGHAINLKTLNDPAASAAKAAKLHLVDEGASLSKQEEFLMSRMVERAPILTHTVGRFNRAATVFLNKLRLDTFKAMTESSGGLNAEEQKAVAHFVNVATGRGSLGALETAAVPLARIMFSPRYFASRLQLAVGQPLWGGTWATRRAIAKEYARTLVGLAAYYAMLKMAFGDKAEVSDDPRSSDFGKIKIGNTRLDPLAGVSQVVVFGARTASGETVNAKGKEKPIRGDKVPFGGDKWTDVAARFARSKLHPVPGAIINLFDGTDLGGNKADLTNQAMNLSGPLTYGDIYQALEEQDLPEGVALGLLAMLGEGLQTYDPNQRHKPAGSSAVPESEIAP